MSEIPKLPIQGSEPVVRPARTTSERADAANGPAFEALLDRLTTRAAELEETSRTLAAPEDLPAAVDAARSSLADALTLGEELLEAFRAAQRGPR